MYIKDELFVFGTGSLGDAIKTLQMFHTAEETNATNRKNLNHRYVQCILTDLADVITA